MITVYFKISCKVEVYCNLQLEVKDAIMHYASLCHSNNNGEANFMGLLPIYLFEDLVS